MANAAVRCVAAAASAICVRGATSLTFRDFPHQGLPGLGDREQKKSVAREGHRQEKAPARTNGTERKETHEET
jgi:hypothetical protein